MSNISITGASGFVGQSLVAYLIKENLQIRILSREDLRSINNSIFEEQDIVIHLAGKAHDLKKVSDPSTYYTINFDLTKDLYQAFIKSDAKKFIFISSVKAVADTVSGILTEDVKPYPQTHYGKSKLLAEEYIQSQILPPGKSYYILRPCMIHGPGNKGNLNLLYQVVKKGVPYPLASFENKRSYLSIDNLNFVIKELIAVDGIPSGIYHIADDEALSTSTVVSILADSLNKSAKLWRISPSFIKVIAKIGDKLHLPLTSERLDKLTESYVVSNQKILKAIHKPLPLSAKRGLRTTALSFQKNNL